MNLFVFNKQFASLNELQQQLQLVNADDWLLCLKNSGLYLGAQTYQSALIQNLQNKQVAVLNNEYQTISQLNMSIWTYAQWAQMALIAKHQIIWSDA